MHIAWWQIILLAFGLVLLRGLVTYLTVLQWLPEHREEVKEYLEATSKYELGFIPPPERDWRGREKHDRVSNDLVSAFYMRSIRPDGKEAESVDIIMKGQPKGMWVTMVDGEIIVLTLNTQRVRVETLDTGTRYELAELFACIRHATSRKERLYRGKQY